MDLTSQCATTLSSACSRDRVTGFRYRGLAVAAAVVCSWAATMVVALRFATPLDHGVVPAAVLFALLTFLYTGLFITAHDAMHGVVAPRDPRLNDAVGRVCVLLYAWFSFSRLRQEHRHHHGAPGTPEDPDFHDGENRAFFSWYFLFLRRYVTIWQLAANALVFNLLVHAAGVPQPVVVTFWVTPALLSTLQLFFFGTYLPHREETHEFTDAHRARSNEFSGWLSFITCYHFGYHHEHHVVPYAPWWKLPAVRRLLKQRSVVGKGITEAL